MKATFTTSVEKDKKTSWFSVRLELSGYEGAGHSATLSIAFERAYEDLMGKVATAISEQAQ